MRESKHKRLAAAVRLKVVMDLARFLGVPVQVHQSYFTETKGSSERNVAG